MTDFNTKTTHELWIESRKFVLQLTRPTPTTLQLTVIYPSTFVIVDGAVILLSKLPIGPDNHPKDGEQYTASLDWAAPADILGKQADGAHVVGFYSSIMGTPLPGTAVPAPPTPEQQAAVIQGVPLAPTTTATTTAALGFSLTVTNTEPNAIYYATIHGASNVLQYYPFGIQSYPIEASRIETGSSSYTGNIPSLPEAPIEPTLGMVYHDRGLNLVQYWTGSQWISTRSDSILSGAVNPGTTGQTYFYTLDRRLKVFNGRQWITASPKNLQFLTPGGIWVPIKDQVGVTGAPPNPELGDFIWDFTSQRGLYWDGVQWIYPTSSNSLFDGPPLIQAFTTPLKAEGLPLPAPYLGQLFYNTDNKVLNVWTGTTWIQANTDQEGTPSTDKISIGTDGSYDERLRLVEVLKSQLGWPVLCVELKEEQFSIAIDNALDTYRQLCDGAYKMAYLLFPLIADQQLYYLNSAVDQTDHIVSIGKIHRLNILGANSLTWDSNIYFQTFLNQYYSAGHTDILSIHLVHSLSEEFQRLFAGDMPFIWDEARRELFIERRISRGEKVILEVMLERSEQELLLDRYCKQFLQNWALAETKEMLGLIRSKYSSGTPGASGPINLNGELLISEARQDMTELREQLLAYEFGGLVGKGNTAFLIG